MRGANHIVWDFRLDHTSTPVLTSAWTQIKSSIAHDCRELEFFDSSGCSLELGIGPSGSEVHLLYIQPGGQSQRIKQILNQGQRLAVRAVSANTAGGEMLINAFY